MAKRYLRTPWGSTVHQFSEDHLIPIKDIAGLCHVSYTTLIKACKGFTAGHKVIPIVDAFMAEYKATHAPPLHPFREDTDHADAV